MSECPIMAKAYQLVRRMNVSRLDKNADVLVITYSDNNEQRAKETITALVEAYNEDGINDKNLIAQKTEQFVSERIALISGELEDVDSKVAQVKRSSGLPEIYSASGLLQQTVASWQRWHLRCWCSEHDTPVQQPIATVPKDAEICWSQQPWCSPIVAANGIKPKRNPSRY